MRLVNLPPGKLEAMESDGERPDAATILDDCLQLIGGDIARYKDDVATKQRFLAQDEARTIATYARALVDMARARKAAEDDPLTPEEERALAELEKLEVVRETLSRARGEK